MVSFVSFAVTFPSKVQVHGACPSSELVELINQKNKNILRNMKSG